MLEILLSSSVLILVLAILRLVLRGKIDSRLQYALWLLVLVRLLVPASFFRSPVSVAEAAAPTVDRVESYASTVIYLPNAPRFLTAVTAADVSVRDEAAPQDASQRFLFLRDAARYIWYGGIAAMGLWFLFVNFRMARRLRKSRTPYGHDGKLPVYVAADLPSPCLFGLFRPAIYLTEQAAADPRQARQIAAHERTHFRHGDLLWALLRSVCLAVWWFNPLVWLAAALSRQDCELACDAGTIKALGEEARYDYGRTLVGMARMGMAKPSDLICGATTMTTGKRSLKERVARIAQGPKTSAAVAVIVLVVAAAAVGCTYAGAVSEETGADAPEPTMTTSPAYEPETAVSILSNADEEPLVLHIPEAVIKAPLFEDGKYLYPDLYDVELYDITIASDRMTFSAEAAPEVYGFDFRAWLSDGTNIPTGRVTWNEESYEDTGRTDYIVYWAAPVDLDRLVRIDHFGVPLDLPAAMDMIPSLELWDFFTDYVENATTSEDFETWADYVYFVNDTNRQMAEDNYRSFGPGMIYNAEQVNDDLAAFLVWYEAERFPSLQFAGRYDGRLYVFRNKDVIPEPLRDGLEHMTLSDPMENGEDMMVMIPDYNYLEEVDRELADFAQPREVEVLLAPDFDAETLDPWTLEDLIYCTDAWQFEYNGEVPANDPRAVILVRDANDRTLYIQDDTDGLLIAEADGSNTWVTIPGGSLTGTEMISRLLPWAETFSDPEAQAAALQARQEEELQALRNALDELGYYSLPDREPVYMFCVEGTIYPITAAEADPSDPHGPCVYQVYNEPEAEGTDLEYQRLYAYEGGERQSSVTAQALARLIEYYSAFTQVTEVSVGKWDGIVILVDGHTPELIWYDADKDLLFSLFVRGPELSDGELIALAETVDEADTPLPAPPAAASDTAAIGPEPIATYLAITYEGHEVNRFMEAPGTQIQLEAEVYPSKADIPVTWSSTDESVASVDDTGLVTITGGSGTCDIIASAGTLQSLCTVYVR